MTLRLTDRLSLFANLDSYSRGDTECCLYRLSPALLTGDSFAKVHRSPAEELSGPRCPALGQLLPLVLFRRGDPACNLRARAEAELVEDAADVAVGGALRDE